MTRTRDQLIEENQGLVAATLARAIPNVPVGIDREDLISEGYLALIRAADRFDPAKGVQFDTFAIHLIRWSFKEYLRQDDWVPRSVRDQVRRGELAEEEVVLLISFEAHRARLEEEGGTIEDLLIAPDDTAAEALENIQRRVVRRAVDWLPLPERAVLDRYYLDGQSERETSVALDRSESRVSQLLARGVARLKGFLGPTLFAEGR